MRERQRTYARGGDTSGWTPGEPVKNMQDLKPGDILFLISHGFQTEWLVKVTRITDLGFHEIHVKPNLQPFQGALETFSRKDILNADPQTDYLRAIPENA